jgi:hypothetical protein
VAVAKVVSVGYTERRGGQTFFLVKDSDTFAFQRNENEQRNDNEKPKGSLVFGWIFRPVLNRPAVEAGPRQVFAVIAVPESDAFAQDCEAPSLSLEVRTYWPPFDRRTATVNLEVKKDLADPLYKRCVPHP